ncbi:MAG: tetratricopeptide repeat protein [Armatimonas sp.]
MEEPLSSVWHFTFFGGVRARRGSEVIDHFRSQKFAFLLAYLAIHPNRQHTREELCDLLWPEADLEAARTNLRTALANLRKTFQDELILTQGYTHVQLNLALFTTDVRQFEDKLKQAKNAQSSVLYQEALRLYTGPFLPNCYDSWALTERDRLTELYLNGSHQLAQLLESESNLDEALQVARQALSIDSLRDELHGEVIRLLLRSGEAALAQKHYEEFAKLLEEQLGLEPSPEVQRLLKETKPAEVKPRVVPEPASVAPAPSPSPSSSSQATLPTPLTRFFGRESEIKQLADLLREPETRLLSITGPGGSGKTRLAIEVGRSIEADFPQGVHFVPLADVRASQFLPDVILRALGQAPGSAPIEQLTSALSGRRLLVLDNLEHLVASAAQLVGELLARTQDLKILATSRVLLLCEGEQEFPINTLPESTSVELFVNRIQALRPDFQLTDTNRAAIIQICTRLEGIPLALELAASRAQMLTPAQILERLDQRLDFLVSRKRDAAERHQTLRAAIDWSYKMLDPALQQFFASLSVFRGGWTLEAAEAVCQEPLALDYLAHLRECSLVVVEEAGEVMRYRLLETLREYAYEQLQNLTKRELTHKHQELYLNLARTAEPNLGGGEQRNWFQRLEADHDNFRAAMERCAEEPERASIGLELCYLLWKFWWAQGYYTEGRARISGLLSVGKDIPPRIYGEARIVQGVFATAQNDYAEARPALEEGLAICRQEEHQSGIALALNNLSIIAREQGEQAAARDYLEEALQIRQAIGDKRGTAGLLNNLGNVYYSLGDEPTSSRYFREALAINRESGNALWMAVNLNNLGGNSQQVGNNSIARRYFEEALALRRSVNDRQGIASSLLSLGMVYLELGDEERAEQALQESLQQSVAVGRRSYISECLQKCGILALHKEKTVLATQLFAASENLVSQIDFKLTPVSQKRLEKAATQARRILSDSDFQKAWSEGMALSFDKAVELALSV